MPESSQDAGQNAALSLEATAERYNFPLSQLQRRVLTGRIPGAFQVTLADGAHEWRIPVSSMSALGYRPVQRSTEVLPVGSTSSQLKWGDKSGPLYEMPEAPSTDEAQLMTRLAEIETRFARLKEQEQRAIQQVAARRSELEARERAVAQREQKTAALDDSAHTASNVEAAQLAQDSARLAALRRQVRFEQAELAATRATVHHELSEIRAAEDRIRVAIDELERRERSLALRERRLEELAERHLARAARD